MKKTIFSMALASMLLFGTSSAFAQSTAENQDNTKKECCKKDGKKCNKKDGKQCDKKDGKKCGKKDGKQMSQADGRKGDRKAPNPFEGLNLTEAQQTQLKAIPTPRQVMKAAKELNKDSKKDQADATKAQGQRKAVDRAIFADYLSQVKAVLTPEQYTQFLENNYVNSSMARIKGMKDGKRNGGKQGMRSGKDQAKKGDRKNHAMKGRKGQERDGQRAQRNS